MSEYRFYQLQRTTLEAVLPTILERAYARGDRVVVLVGSEERAEALSALLWTYNERSFLPHGTARDGHSARQPIYLTHEAVNANGANVLVQCDGAVWADGSHFPLVCDIFDGNDPDALGGARERWRRLAALGQALKYFRQDAGGRWEEATRNQAPPPAGAAEPPTGLNP